MQDVADNSASQTDHTPGDKVAIYRTLIDNFPDGLIAIFDHDLRYTEVGGQGLALFGLQAQDLLGKRPRDVMPPQGIASAEPLMQAALRGEHSDALHQIMGQTSRIQVLPVRDEAGNVICGMIINQTLTQLEAAQQAQRESEAFLQTAMDNLPEGAIFIFDRDLRYILARGRTLASGSYSSQDLEGRTIYEALQPNALRYIEAQYKAALAGEAQLREYTYKGRHYLTRSAPIYDQGEIIAGLLISQDITDLKQAEQTAQDNERRYKLLTDVTFEGIVIHENGVLIDANRAFYDLFGYEQGTLIGQQVIDIVFAPESRPLIREHVRKQSTDSYEVLGLHSDGSSFPLEIEARQLSATMRVACVRDVRERQLARKQAIEMQLERERMDLLTSFIQNTTHEFRTPLSTINASTHLMVRSDEREQRQQRADKIVQQVRRITRLVDMLLKMARLDAQPPQLRTLDVSRWLHSHMDLLEAGMGLSNVAYDLPDDLPLVYADAELLLEGLRPLLDNALRYSEPGKKITLRTAYTAPHVYIQVIDEGVGIQEHELPFIFQMFWRTDYARSTPGLGLGLPIARQIARIHNGDVLVQSQPGVGSTFSIQLPTQNLST